MSHTFRFVVTVEVERTTGKFAPREELADLMIQELEGANPGTLDGENEGQYEIQSWDVEEEVVSKPKRTKRVTAMLDKMKSAVNPNPEVK